MATPAPTMHVWRFGLFEVDAHREELRRAGVPLKVREQPFRILVFLLEHNGEIVTREQLRSVLWPQDVFVDFDHSLNTAMMKLREALGDTAEKPLYIETIPKKGYRFVAPVTGSDGMASAGEMAAVSAGALPRPAACASVAVTTTMKVRARRRWVWYAAGAAIAAIGVTLSWRGWWWEPPVPYVTSIEAITHDGLPKYNPKNDGSRVYFTELAHNREFLSQVSAGGGEISQIASPLANTEMGDVAPDGSKLLVTEPLWNMASQVFWIVPLPAGSAHRLGALDGYDAAWSSDGKRLVFARQSEIWTAESDGTNPKRLLATAGLPRYMQFSPDDERIRYTLYPGRTVELWESRKDGSAPHALLPGWRSHYAHLDGVWSPDGRYYAFVERTNPSGGIVSGGQVWMLPEARRGWSWLHRTAAPVQLTHGPVDFYGLSFAPGGKTLFAAGISSRGELVRNDPGTRQVFPYLSGISAGDLAFSRDGQWIAYISYPDETLWRCRIDGSDRLQLTTTGSATLPQWSPDGTRIAYTAGGLGERLRTAIISAGGGTPQDADQGDWSEVDPNWSPDGNQLIFGVMANPGFEIREIDLRTHKVTPVPGAEGLYSPRWSPDGRWLAALSSSDAQRLMIYDFNKQLWTTWITAQDVHTQNVAYPVWSRDSHLLYFGTIFSRGVDDISEWRIRPGEHVAEKILDLHDEPRYVGPWSVWSTVGPDGAVYFTRDRSTSEIYALHLSEK